MTIIIIIVGCWFLYKAGVVGLFLDRFKLEEYHTQVETPGTQATTTGPKPTQQNDTLTEREKLEKAAAYIVEKSGHNPQSVKYMSVGLLQAVINDYIKENK